MAPGEGHMGNTKRRWCRIKRLGPWLILLSVSVVFRKLLPWPFVWVFFLWFAFLLGVAILARRKPAKLVAFNACLLFLGLATVESALWIWPQRGGQEHRYEGTYRGDYYRDVDILGYGAKPDKKSTSRKIIDDHVAYDVVYSIDSHGLRVTPAAKSTSAPAVLFFGGSFTFGEGVQDNESMPYQVGEMTGGKYQVINLGFHGYGPHQLLAALENHMIDEIASSEPRFVIYQALPTHVQRSAGLARWDRYGPKYALTDAGDVVHVGPFQGRSAKWVRKKLLRDSSIGEFLSRIRRPPHPQDVELFGGIVTKARDIVETSWPEAEFHVLLWDDQAEDDRYRQALQSLRDHGLKVHQIANVLPDIRSDRQKYLIPRGRHPNKLVHHMIARYVVEHIVRDELSQDSP